MSKEPVLCLPGPAFSYRFDGDFSVRGTPLRIHAEGGQGRGTGWSVWDGSVVASLWLQEAAQTGRIEPSSILELGSGTGLAGIAAALAFRTPTVLSDLPEVLPALHRNVALNPAVTPHVRVEALDWLAPHSPNLGQFDLVVAADCVWVQDLVPPFVEALQRHVHTTSTVLLVYQSRSNAVDALLFSLLKRAFTVSAAGSGPPLQDATLPPANKGGGEDQEPAASTETHFNGFEVSEDKQPVGAEWAAAKVFLLQPLLSARGHLIS